jgi:hypothetical protein
MYELIPMYSPQAIMNMWGIITEGVDEVLKYTNGDSTKAKTFNEIMSGNLLLWVAYSDGQYCGYMTTRIDDIPTAYKCLSIIHVYVKDHKLKDLMLAKMSDLNEFAKSQGCTRLRMWTIREVAFSKVLSDWKVGYHEMVKEVV